VLLTIKFTSIDCTVLSIIMCIATGCTVLSIIMHIYRLYSAAHYHVLSCFQLQIEQCCPLSSDQLHTLQYSPLSCVQPWMYSVVYYNVQLQAVHPPIIMCTATECTVLSMKIYSYRLYSAANCHVYSQRLKSAAHYHDQSYILYIAAHYHAIICSSSTDLSKIMCTATESTVMPPIEMCTTTDCTVLPPIKMCTSTDCTVLPPIKMYTSTDCTVMPP
jgi:hypothetical protein